MAYGNFCFQYRYIIYVAEQHAVQRIYLHVAFLPVIYLYAVRRIYLARRAFLSVITMILPPRGMKSGLVIALSSESRGFLGKRETPSTSFGGFWALIASVIGAHLHVRASKLGSVQGVRSVEVTDAALIRWLRTAPYEEV